MKNPCHFLFALGLTALLTAAAGCSHTQEVSSYTNPITGVRTDILAENLLEAPGVQREMLWLNAFRDHEAGGGARHHLQMIVARRANSEWLDIGPGRTLTLVVDGKELSFVGLGSLSREKGKDGILVETARYDATAEIMAQLAGATSVSVRVKGKSELVVREFGPANFQKFKDFVALATAPR